MNYALRKLLRAAVAALILGSGQPAGAADQPPVAIAIHGGAGTMTREQLGPGREAAYRAALTAALEAGYRILQNQGGSLDAVSAAVTALEDSPLFNAGKGAVFTHDGRNELDAAIMDGRTLQAGAVAGLTHVRNPILLARAVMEHSPHVFMVGAGAEEFALAQGLALVPRDYFYTPERWEQLERARKRQHFGLGEKLGTVGAVALDAHGNLAAATSTGGLTNKRYGRIGDVPVIGAGTYADNRTCAISATGDGEYFIRAVAAHDIAARMAYGGNSLEDAAREVIEQRLIELGGDGGVIAVDAKGNIAMVFNTPGMYRAAIDTRRQRVVKIYRD